MLPTFPPELLYSAFPCSFYRAFPLRFLRLLLRLCRVTALPQGSPFASSLTFTLAFPSRSVLIFINYLPPSLQAPRFLSFTLLLYFHHISLSSSCSTVSKTCFILFLFIHFFIYSLYRKQLKRKKKNEKMKRLVKYCSVKDYSDQKWDRCPDTSLVNRCNSYERRNAGTKKRFRKWSVKAVKELKFWLTLA